jgi:glycerate dehydrogenase
VRSVFLDYSTVSWHGDLDPAPLLAVLPGLELHADSDEAALAARLAGTRIVVTNKVALSRERLAIARDLELIALTATGTNMVDLEAARAQGVGVCNIENYCTASVVQQTFALILALTQRLGELDRAVKQQGWRHAGEEVLPAHPIRELGGRILGIVGYGALGQGVARAAGAFGLEVLIAKRPGAAATPGRVALDTLLPVVDILSLHCPVTADTRGLIGARELALMKTDAIIVNTARGALIDGRALAAALSAGRLAGAGLDVVDPEPPPRDHPLLAPGVPNLILTPHSAWGAREARQRALAEVAANIRDFLGGGRRGRVV